MKKALSISVAQLNWLVGDLEGNTDRILQAAKEQEQAGADLVMFSELALCGYLPEDLLYRDDFYQRVEQQLARLQQACSQTAILVGHPWRQDGKLYNALSFFSQGTLLTRYFKQLLPNYSVFDEERYFTAGTEDCILTFKGYRLGLLICEDLWANEPIDRLKNLGAEFVLTINASPYDWKKPYIRDQLLSGHTQRTGLPLIYLNQIGGQDELVFDGRSKVFDATGKLTHRLAAFAEQTMLVRIEDNQIQMTEPPTPDMPQLAHIYSALVLALRDYVTKNGFPGVILGLSGGIDSALTLAIAVDALGKDNVQAVMMPFHYTAAMSI